MDEQGVQSYMEQQTKEEQMKKTQQVVVTKQQKKKSAGKKVVESTDVTTRITRYFILGFYYLTIHKSRVLSFVPKLFFCFYEV